MTRKRAKKRQEIIDELQLDLDDIENNISKEAKLQIYALRKIRESSIANKTRSLLTFITEKDIKRKGFELAEVFERILQVLIRTEKDKKARVNLITLSGDRKKLGNIDKCYINSEVTIYNNLTATPLLGLGTYYKVFYIKDKSEDKRYLAIIRYTEEI